MLVKVKSKDEITDVIGIAEFSGKDDILLGKYCFDKRILDYCDKVVEAESLVDDMMQIIGTDIVIHDSWVTMPTSEEREIVSENPKSEWTDKHYNFDYKLTREDIDRGYIRVDAYFVCAVWGLFKRDGGSGILFHVLKTILRIGKKVGNSFQREIDAIKAQLDNLARFI